MELENKPGESIDVENEAQFSVDKNSENEKKGINNQESFQQEK